MTFEEQEKTFNQVLEEKFGKFATIDIDVFWNGSKEEYLKQFLKMEAKKLDLRHAPEQYINVFGVYFSKNMFGGKRHICTVCGKYNYKLDDLRYCFRYETCQRCYIRYIEAREARWKEGWRPNGR